MKDHIIASSLLQIEALLLTATCEFFYFEFSDYLHTVWMNTQDYGSCLQQGSTKRIDLGIDLGIKFISKSAINCGPLFKIQCKKVVLYQCIIAPFQTFAPCEVRWRINCLDFRHLNLSPSVPGNIDHAVSCQVVDVNTE